MSTFFSTFNQRHDVPFFAVLAPVEVVASVPVRGRAVLLQGLLLLLGMVGFFERRSDSSLHSHGFRRQH